MFKKIWNWIKDKANRFKKWLIVGILGASALASTVTLQNGSTVNYDRPISTDGKAIGWNEPVNQGEESLFSEIGEDGTVIRTIVIDADVVNSGKFGDPTKWVRTYKDGRIRGSFGNKNYGYNASLDAFIPPKPVENAVFDDTTLKWTYQIDLGEKASK